MLEGAGDEDESKLAAGGTLRRLGACRVWRPLAVGGLAALSLVALGGAWVYSQVKPVTCSPLGTSDLTIDEMIAIKRRVEKHSRDSSAPLSLSGREASFLLADNLRYPVRLTVEGSEVEAEVALREAGGDRCYNIDFRGGVAIDDGVARLTPSHVVVGELDLSGWLAGTQVTVHEDDLRGEHARRLLSRTRHLEVVDGQLLVRIDDMGSLR